MFLYAGLDELQLYIPSEARILAERNSCLVGLAACASVTALYLGSLGTVVKSVLLPPRVARLVY